MRRIMWRRGVPPLPGDGRPAMELMVSSDDEGNGISCGGGGGGNGDGDGDGVEMVNVVG